MGVTQMTVSRWTTNKVQPYMAKCVAMSKILEVALKDLIEDEEIQ